MGEAPMTRKEIDDEAALALMIADLKTSALVLGFTEDKKSAELLERLRARLAQSAATARQEALEEAATLIETHNEYIDKDALGGTVLRKAHPDFEPTRRQHLQADAIRALIDQEQKP